MKYTCATSVHEHWHHITLLCLPRTSCNDRRLFVRRFVCLLATSLRKIYWTDLHENFNADVSVHKEELIKLWKLSASWSMNFSKDSSTLRDRAFSHNLTYISGESDRIFMKITDVSSDKEVPVKSQRNPDLESLSRPYLLGGLSPLHGNKFQLCALFFAVSLPTRSFTLCWWIKPLNPNYTDIKTVTTWRRRDGRLD